jgi:hypothetical protein
MSAQTPVTFAVATYGTGEILAGNFLASPCLRAPHSHQIVVQKDYISAAKAYNAAIDRAENELLIFAHQDMIFPESWLSQLQLALDHLDRSDPGWGVLGCYGMTQQGQGRGYIYSPGRGIIGQPCESPMPIQTLDEIVLIFRKSSGLRFDDALPHFHLYGTDICLRAAKMGMKSYAISALCVHNAHQYVVLPREFYECCRHIRRAWKQALPIQTTCLCLTKFNFPMYGRRLREIRLQHIGRKAQVTPRMQDIPQLLKRARAAVPGM